MKSSRLILTALSGLFALGTVVGRPAVAKADTASTAAIVAGVAAIAGAIIYDSNNHPYYVRNNRRYYITQSEEQYYRSRHRGVERRAYVPEQEYPVARNPYQNRGNGNYQHH